MNRFCFIDSSGIKPKDPFLGTGLLVVKSVGDLTDKLNKNSQPAKERTRLSKDEIVASLLAKGNKDEVIAILRSNKRFEMKFDNVRTSVGAYYEHMVDIFLSDKKNRFSAMIVDRKHPKFDKNHSEDAWETYTKYAAELIVLEMRNLPPDDKFCIIVDEITRPRNKPFSLEDTLLSKIEAEISKNPSLKYENIFGALSIESHSNFLMQLSDVLLGAVMFDYKKKANLVTPNMSARKEPLVNKIRTALMVDTLAQDFVTYSPSYFKVFESVQM